VGQEQQRVVVVDPGTRISFFIRQVSPTRPRYAAAAAAYNTALGNSLIKNKLLLVNYDSI